VQRKELYAKHGPVISQWAPGSELACKELMEMAIQFVCARYPQYFTLSDDKVWLENRILGVRANIRDKHPLLVLLDHIPEDFALMLRDPDTGNYVLRAGTICSALGWSLGAKFGLKLHEIHGPVPDYKEKMQFSMDRYVPLPHKHASEAHTVLSHIPFILVPTNNLPHFTQLLLQDAHQQADPARLMGFRNRRAPLHGSGGPTPRGLPKHAGPPSDAVAPEPARGLADAAPAPALGRRRLQLQGRVHAP